MQQEPFGSVTSLLLCGNTQLLCFPTLPPPLSCFVGNFLSDAIFYFSTRNYGLNTINELEK